ncbi:MAG: HAMP domain-containing protein [Deltaproteobacteria bacterium]|nr:HAMP domain-containing protein [Deltaproteobacteria bacterium]
MRNVLSLPSGIARRLILSFGSVIVVFGVAAVFAMRGLGEVHVLLHGVKAQERSVRTALELASAVRDQYAHQAHTIILGNETHLAYYGQARGLVRSRVLEARSRLDGPEEVSWLNEIDRASGELDEIFTKRIVPAVLAQDRDVILEEHAHAQALVSLIQDRADRLVTSNEAEIERFEDHAAVVQHASVRAASVFFVLALLLGTALAFYVGRSVAGPVRLLESGAARIAAGDLETRIEIRSNDEVGRLASAFNAMTEALREHQRRLIESEKLAGLGRLAAGVAHEINNPLAVILGYTRLLRRASTSEVDDELRMIEEEAVRCQAIVEGLLDLSRPLRVESEPVLLRELCEEAIERLEDAGRTAGVQVSISGHATARGSTLQLRQVLMNLIQNAVEAAGANGRVSAEIRRPTDGFVEVAIHDSGAGLTAEHRKKLFEPFFTTKSTGTGLGLAVSKAIARAHGGDIDAFCEPGKETVFVLRLPSAEGR